MAPIIVCDDSARCANRSMRIVLPLAALGSLGLGQPAPAPVERGTLRLHYVQKPIGYERYEIAPDGDGGAAS